MKNIGFLILSLLMMSASASYGANLSVQVSYVLHGWTKKEAGFLVQAIKQINEATIALSIADTANSKIDPLQGFACRMNMAEMTLLNPNDIYVASDLVCQGGDANALRAFNYKRFVELTLSRKFGMQVSLLPTQKPGSATVHN